MSTEEKRTLEVAILTISDPKGNWHKGWEMLCEMAELDAKRCRPPFKPHPFEEPPRPS